MKSLSVRFKITVSFLITILLTSLMVWFSLEKTESEAMDRVNHSQYSAVFNQIINITEYNEKVSERHLFASLKAVEGELKSRTEELTNEYLATLQEKYHLSGIYTFNHQGYMEKASIYDLLVEKGFLPGFNLFERCEEERELLGTTGVFKKTPMLWIRDVKDPSKFFWTYSADLGYILEVTYMFGELDKIFREIKNTFNEIQEISLITPAQKIMASSLSREEQNSRNLNELPEIEYGESEWQEGPRTVLLKSFGPVTENLCSVTSPYFYTLRLVFDSSPGIAAAARSENTPKRFLFLAPAALLILLLFFYSLRLVNGIVALNRRMLAYMDGNESLTRTPPSQSGDEISQINGGFDRLVLYIDELMKKEKQLTRYKAIGQTTEYLAHDIREPFSKIKALLQLIRKTQQNLSDKVEKYIPVIENSSERVEAMLTDIMNFGSVVSLNLKDCSLNEVIDSCFRHHIAPDFSKDMLISCNPNHKSLARMDSYKIFRVLVNLLNNAMLATEAGGRITLSTEEEQGFISVKVHNTGSYIPPEKFGTIFEPFVKGRMNGTGLGLAIVKDIVEAHRGQIFCQSTEADGTSFVFTIPLAKGEDRFQVKMPDQLWNQSKERPTFGSLSENLQ